MYLLLWDLTGNKNNKKTDLIVLSFIEINHNSCFQMQKLLDIHLNMRNTVENKVLKSSNLLSACEYYRIDWWLQTDWDKSEDIYQSFGLEKVLTYTKTFKEVLQKLLLAFQTGEWHWKRKTLISKRAIQTVFKSTQYIDMYNKYVIVPLLRWRGTKSIINRRKTKEQRVTNYSSIWSRARQQRLDTFYKR